MGDRHYVVAVVPVTVRVSHWLLLVLFYGPSSPTVARSARFVDFRAIAFAPFVARRERCHGCPTGGRATQRHRLKPSLVSARRVATEEFVVSERREAKN